MGLQNLPLQQQKYLHNLSLGGLYLSTGLDSKREVKKKEREKRLALPGIEPGLARPQRDVIPPVGRLADVGTVGLVQGYSLDHST